ncbi:MAG TPA: tyrosine-type recombinase/integrase [Mycobacterium sp.]|jgi:integrase|nr:tyrosine-type recombinase/integrase [Mycobacterium sp.]
MATIESYETSTGATRYTVRYRTPARTQTKRRGFTTKRDAQEFANTVEVEKMTGAYVAPSLGMITVGELAPAWLSRKESDVAPSNYRTLESAWRIHVKPVWGIARIADIDLAAVERWVATIRKASGATTVVRAYGVLAGILDDAVKSRRLAANPSRGVENLPHKAGNRRVYLTVDDVARLAAESGQHRALVLTLAYTGIRWGEAVALRVRDIQFLRRRLSVNDNAVQLGIDHAVGRTKSRQERSVPVRAFVLDELALQCEGRSLDGLVFGDGAYLPRPKSRGGWFAGAVKRAKVQKITPHDLRHSCASIAISSGVNVLALSRMLGHTSAKVTLDTYADLFDTDLDAVAEALDSKCAQSVPKRVPAAAPRR